MKLADLEWREVDAQSYYRIVRPDLPNGKWAKIIENNDGTYDIAGPYPNEDGSELYRADLDPLTAQCLLLEMIESNPQR